MTLECLSIGARKSKHFTEDEQKVKVLKELDTY